MCACEFLCLGATKPENMAGRPRCLIPLSALPPLTSASSPRWSALPVTLQTSQLSCFFTVKVLTNHERCQYGGPLIRVWLAHESCHTCVCAWSSSGPGAPCVMAGGEPDGGPNSSTHSGSQRPALSLHTDVSNALAPASAVLIQTCESDTN